MSAIDLNARRHQADEALTQIRTDKARPLVDALMRFTAAYLQHDAVPGPTTPVAELTVNLPGSDGLYLGAAQLPQRAMDLLTAAFDNATLEVLAAAEVARDEAGASAASDRPALTVLSGGAR